MDEVRVGIIGSGFMGRTHAVAVTRFVSGARLVAVTGGSRAPQLARDFEIDAVEEMDAFLARGDIDAVIVTTPQVIHARDTLAAAERGKHVLVEKPLATTVEDCDAMIQACEKAGVRLMTGQSQRYRGGNLAAKEVLKSGELGKILMVEEIQVNVGGLGSLPGWQSERENVGTLLGYGCHNLDRLRWFLEDEAEWVAGVTTSYTENAAAEASSMLLLKFHKGTAATFWCTFEAPKPGLPASGFRSRIVGEKGLLDVDGFGITQVGRGDSWEVLFEQPKFDFRAEPFSPVRMAAYGKQDQEFINSIREQRRPEVTGEDGRAAVEMALAAYQSSDCGDIIRLPLKRN